MRIPSCLDRIRDRGCLVRVQASPGFELDSAITNTVLGFDTVNGSVRIGVSVQTNRGGQTSLDNRTQTPLSTQRYLRSLPSFVPILVARRRKP